jgi:hypothetical protein
VLAAALFAPFACLAQQTAPQVRIAGPIDEDQLVTLQGNVNPHAIAKNDRGPVSGDLALSDMTLVLSRSPERQAAFDAYVESEYEAGSPNFHQWLTPAQIGEQFGPAQADVATISNWLTVHGFVIKSIPQDRMTIRFSGTAGQAEAAFHTQIHNLSVNGVAHYANMTNPQIPAALSPVVVGIKALHNFLPHPLHRLGNKVQLNKQTGKWQRVASPAAAEAQSSATGSASANKVHTLFGINVPGTSQYDAYLEEDVTPYDFATIYNVQPLWTAGITGTGQTIAIAGTSEINLSDITTYRSAFGLPAYGSGAAPQQIDTGDGPAATECTSTSSDAQCGIGDLEENTLDVEASGAVATSAQIKLVVTGQNVAGTIDTVFDSAQYVVQNLTAKILSVSYGECELFQGTSSNVAYYNLWQSAAAEGISVFVASGDSGSPACDDGLDAQYGFPYTAQGGLSVSGIASTPFNTAVGGTDFSWCQPYFSGNNFEGCPTSSTSQGSPAYWNTTNSANGASAAGYVPETAWNDTCENPILAKYLETFASTQLGVSGLSTPEETCNFIYNDWTEIEAQEGINLSYYVDTAGGSGGASSCVSNSADTDPDNPTCTSGSISTGSSNGSITLYNNGWPKPAWQKLGVPGMPGDGVRDIPDVSFFAGDGTLDSATLICVSALGACTYGTTVENTAQEVGGTSVGSPEMAGVMALIDQKVGAAQGLANPELYNLAQKQTYSSCSAESVKNTSTGCFYNDVDAGTNAMACDLPGGIEGGQYEGSPSPNCVAINNGDNVGTLVSSGTTPAYNAGVGYDLATGLGSLNVTNVVNNWASDAGTASSTMAVSLSATTITAGTTLTVTVTMTGSGSLPAPTGTVVVSGGGYSASGMLATTTGNVSSATVTIPPSSLAPGSVTLTVIYSGDGNYASLTETAPTVPTITVQAVTPTVSVQAPMSDNVANAISVFVAVTGPPSAPTASGDVSLTSGSYSSNAVTLSSSGTATFNIPANALAAGSDVVTVTYNGSTNYYAQGTGTATIVMSGAALVAPTITITPTPTTVDSSQSLSVVVALTGTPTPTGTVTLTAGTYNSATTGPTALVAGVATFTVPGNSLSSGTATITATYSGDANYSAGTKTASETVTQSIYALAASAASPATVAPGASATSTITGNASITDYTGTVTLNSCTVTGPTTAVNLPSCSVSGAITYASGAATGSGTATVSTTSNTAMLQTEPGGKGWLGAGGGAVLAFLVFLGVPARRRSWRAMLGILVLLTALGSLTACGGGSTNSGGTGGSGSTATSPGAYTFTVTGTGNDPAKTAEIVTFTLTVN